MKPTVFLDDSLITDEMMKKSISKCLQEGGFTYDGKHHYIDGELSKQRIRQFHQLAYMNKLDKARNLIQNKGEHLTEQFAHGTEIDPRRINPSFTEVKAGTFDADLFKFASLFWTVPVSEGFGRRMRFLVRDKQNGKLIGLIGIGDPVFNLSVRDKAIGWNVEERRERLIHVMDAYVCGAVPPYSMIIGGKLIAALLGSDRVKQTYNRKYFMQTSVISQRSKKARLALITTTSALGRSSIYNRLRIPNGPEFTRVGTTRGYGHFHITDELFSIMQKYLLQIDHPYAHGNRFGMGPNWRIRLIRAALEKVGFSDDILQHGIEREVYMIPLAYNWEKVLHGDERRLCSRTLPVKVISEYCKQRWILPRSLRDDIYRSFNVQKTLDRLLNGQAPTEWLNNNNTK